MMKLDVMVLSPTDVIFEGKVKSVIVPGEQGVFEIQPFHKRILSRLVGGTMTIDGQRFPMRRGIVRVNQNRVTVVMEEDGS